MAKAFVFNSMIRGMEMSGLRFVDLDMDNDTIIFEVTEGCEFDDKKFKLGSEAFKKTCDLTLKVNGMDIKHSNV